MVPADQSSVLCILFHVAVVNLRPELVILPEDVDTPQLDLNILQLDMDILLEDTNILPPDTVILPPDGVPRTDIIVDDRFHLALLMIALTYCTPELRGLLDKFSKPGTPARSVWSDCYATYLSLACM
ncbi:hypothetical protein EV715DRAFT_294092 [Schizophyllum commune]